MCVVDNMAAAAIPAEFMQQLVGKRVIVKLKWGPQHIATLVSTDSFMNLLLRDCEEHCPGEDADEAPVVMEEVLLRCNNVLYIREVPDGAEPVLAQ